jgi:hypothetical protein
LVDQPRQRVAHWTQVLAALDSPLAPPLADITAHYDPAHDQAVLELRYDEMALANDRLAFIVEVAVLAEVGMIQPAELAVYQRQRVLEERLDRCKLSLPHQRSVIGALGALVKKLRDQRTPPPVPAPAMSPRGEDDPGMVISAKGTRDNVPKVKQPTPSPDAPASGRHIIGRAHRMKTSEIAPELAARLVTGTRPTPPVVPASSAPFAPVGPETQERIFARYLRGTRWVPARIGALSLKSAALLTGALPRLHDRVEIAFVYATYRAIVRGGVSKVSSVREAAASGASTFSITFEHDDISRRQMTELLVAAREAKIVIKPPPARQTRRFPVEWPATLSLPRGRVDVCALDVSTGGMFVRPAKPLEIGQAMPFSIGLDDSALPVEGRVAVVRTIDDAEAARCGLASGFGLAIVEMTEADRMRWLAFLARVERRAEKRVLIGAAPARFAELQAMLAGSGYAVSGGTDPGALVQLASNDARPADAVLIDAGWLQNGAASSWVESLFAARNVPCVTLQGDARRARSTVDKLLEVVV